MATPTRSEWDWLSDTFWYVVPEDLPALQYDAARGALEWVDDQTVWHITGSRGGYVWGVAAVMVREPGAEAPHAGPRSRPRPLALFGSVTPAGGVHLTFVPDVALSSRSATVGVGRMVRREEEWGFEMQMSSGTGMAHWACMLPTRPGDASWASLPGVGLGVPEMLAGCTPPRGPAGATAG